VTPHIHSRLLALGFVSALHAAAPSFFPRRAVGQTPKEIDEVFRRRIWIFVPARAACGFHIGFPNMEALRNATRDARRQTGIAHRVPAVNSLLAALPRKECQHLIDGLEPVALAYGEVLYEPGEPIKYVYFPTDSIVSLLTLVDQHHALEVGLVGREGMVGIPLALEIMISPVRALVQGTGTAMRMKAAPFLNELRQNRRCSGSCTATLII